VEHALRIGLRAELLPGPIELEVTGCLTVVTVGALLRVLVRSMALDGCPGIIVDLRAVETLEPAALMALEAHASAHEEARRILGRDAAKALPAVRIQAPAPPWHGEDLAAVPAHGMAG